MYTESLRWSGKKKSHEEVIPAIDDFFLQIESMHCNTDGRSV